MITKWIQAQNYLWEHDIKNSEAVLAKGAQGLLGVGDHLQQRVVWLGSKPKQPSDDDYVTFGRSGKDTICDQVIIVIRLITTSDHMFTLQCRKTLMWLMEKHGTRVIVSSPDGRSKACDFDPGGDCPRGNTTHSPTHQ